MNILAVDDERLALEALEASIREAEPQGEVTCFRSAAECLEWAAAHPCDVAFLDIRLRATTGLELALRLKRLQPKINIIFATGYEEYSLSAVRQHCSGYLLKPVQAEDVRCELDNLRSPVPPARDCVFAQTFGNFELFKNGAPVPFPSAKCKEVLAYLIDRRGAAVSNGEIASVVWEGNGNTASAQALTRKAKADLIAALREPGLNGLLLVSRNTLAVDSTKLDCDYWQLLAGDAAALNKFTYEYMTNYSWGEQTLAALLRLVQNR